MSSFAMPRDGYDSLSEASTDGCHRTLSPDGDGSEPAGGDSRIDGESANNPDTDGEGEGSMDQDEDFGPAIPRVAFLNLVRTHPRSLYLAKAHSRSTK